METGPIKEGRRVECKAQGSFNGKRGRVEDVWMGQALVYFNDNAVTLPVEYFQPVSDL